jgi:AbrB family looped-hinge helix DNA binding protein
VREDELLAIVRQNDGPSLTGYLQGGMLPLQDRKETTTDTTVDTKGQIIIPREIRRQLGIKKGSYLHIAIDDKNRIVLTPITRTYINALRGKYKGRGLLNAFVSMKNREANYGES